MTALLLILWAFSGVAGFIFWWTSEYDFTLGELPIAIFSAALGPLAWFSGWSIHGRENKTTPVLWRKRK